MDSNIVKYKKDLEKLIDYGKKLEMSIANQFAESEFKIALKNFTEKEYNKFVEKLPDFTTEYQVWYSETLVIIKQLLPDRLSDFVRLYEKPKIKRKDLIWENYTIEDSLSGLKVSRLDGKEIVGPKAAIPLFQQQLYILKSVKTRFTSTLFDIKLLLQADLFDSELEVAKELNNKGFIRGAGAIAGVVLERHLSQICENHSIKITKKNPSISYLNDKLKNENIYEIPVWRKIQHLGDLRNLCDHNKKRDPKVEEIQELIEGVEKITKTLF